MSHTYVPQYEGLMLKDISNFLGRHEEAFDYFPDGREQAKLPK